MCEQNRPRLNAVNPLSQSEPVGRLTGQIEQVLFSAANVVEWTV